MATVARNIRYRNIFDSVSFAHASGTSFNEGDLLCVDTGTKLVRPIAAAGDIDTMVGDALGTFPVAHHTNWKPYTVGVNCSNHTVKLIARNAAAFDLLTPVYYNTDAQSFATTGTGNPLGFMMVQPSENNGVHTGTTVVGKEYEILLQESYIFSNRWQTWS